MVRDFSGQVIEIYRSIKHKAITQPLFTFPVSAGFPSPTDDYIEGKLDLNRHLIQNPIATFFVRVTGDSMMGTGIHSGDLLVVDRSLEPRDGQVAIAVVDGELLVKRLRWRKSPTGSRLTAMGRHWAEAVLADEVTKAIASLYLTLG